MKILIIKLGLSETLDPEIGRVSSLGDVLRTTPILHALKEKYPTSKIDWVVDEAAFPLLNGNKFIDKILVWDSFVGFQLMSERYDLVINLEKIPGLCAITNKINAWKKYGFRFDENEGGYSVFDGAEYALELCTKHDTKKNNNKTWQEILVEMIGCEWKRQPYVLGYRPQSETRFDVGFNHKVGPKFPEKAWSDKHWMELEGLLTSDCYRISWQEGLNDLYGYIEWINACRLVVTNDSLGLHIALALEKPVVALFGPTSSREVFMYNDGISFQNNDINQISSQEVYSAIKHIIHQNNE